MAETRSDSNNAQLSDDVDYRLLKLLAEQPEASQRDLAQALGVSLGKINYCIKALLDQGWIKATNFKNSKNKLAYAYLLTPSGIDAKARLTARFLRRKLAEYEALKAEIARLQAEVWQPESPPRAKPQVEGRGTLRPSYRASEVHLMEATIAHLQDPLTPLAIIGLGYVGLPLAVEFGKHRPVVGFDINPARIAELQGGRDSTLEVTPDDLREARHLRYTSDPEVLRTCRIYIITVPTPVDAHKRPDLTPLRKASETVGRVLKPGDLVIYESTVYPGCTEEDCVPVLERHSGLSYLRADRRRSDPSEPPNPERRANRRGDLGRAQPGGQASECAAHEPDRMESTRTPPPGFYCGYSPERINPGDPTHRLTTIKKVTSGSTPEVAAAVDALYRQIITAGTHPASSIRVAEAAKVIENTQRDLNIALMNELALIFGRLGIDTLEVLEAAGSKWNFLSFRPGLVGGHCIGVDPYYLTHKAVAVGYHPEVILAGRRINDRMGAHVAEDVVKLSLRRGIGVCHSRMLVLGLAFKENCPDLRNTRVIDIIHGLRDYSIRVDCYDPWIDRAEARHEYGLDCLAGQPAPGTYDAVILAVAHRDFIELGAEGLRRFGKTPSILYDVKSVLPVDSVDARL